MKNKLLVICGQTATGKTSMGLKLAEKFNGEIVSADSRQVYRGLDIGTGKDIPKSFGYRVSNLDLKDLEVGYYSDGKIRIWGYDLVDPDKGFDVSLYLTFARTVIKDIWKRSKLPIIVGGTGLYINGLLYGIESANIPKNDKLRIILDRKDKKELSEMLAQIDPIKFASMNTSDRNNIRRLVRAVEIANWKLENRGFNFQKVDPLIAETLVIGLKAEKNYLSEKLKKRIKKRIDGGFQEEVERLVISGITWESQSMNTLGYRQYKEYFLGKLIKSRIIENWLMAELKYAKRQLTWFKKSKNVNWFDIGKKSYTFNIENMVSKWHNK